MATIYKITNQVNGKVYVGATTNTLLKRWNSHKSSAKTQPKQTIPLYVAIREFGLEQFTIEPIEECQDQERYERERYWIEKLETVENGYNACKGYCEIDHDAVAENLRKTGSTYETARQTGIGVSHVWGIAKDFNIELGPCNEDKRIPIIAITKNGERIEFDSVSDGARYCIENGLTNSTKAGHMVTNIKNVCIGKYKHTYGMEWQYKNTANDR